MKLGIEYKAAPNEGYLKSYQARVRKATARAIDKTMAEAVRHARRDHPGWERQTGTAEQDIDIVALAHESPHAQLMGLWGSIPRGLHEGYGGVLEHKFGGALRSAAVRTYPRVTKHLKRELQRA